MNVLDASVIALVNQFSGTSPEFDRIVHAISHNELIKGGVLMTMFWWAWFSHGTRQHLPTREHLCATLTACFIAMPVARALALLLPYRERPVHDPEIGFIAPYPIESHYDWSAFPSDHAALFFTLATGMFFVSKRLGILALAHTVIIICLPRLYLGLHYLTDMLAGAALGGGLCWLANRTRLLNRVTQELLRMSNSAAGFFYAGLFLLTYQIATLFQDLRWIGSGALRFLRALAGDFG